MSFTKPSMALENKAPTLNCGARGCINRWSVKIEGPLCSYHAWANPKEWPAITEALQRDGPWRLSTGETVGVREMKKLLKDSIGNFGEEML